MDSRIGTPSLLIRVVKGEGLILDADERTILDKIALRFASQISLIDTASSESGDSIGPAYTAGYLFFVPIGASQPVRLEQLDQKPTVIVWRGNPPRDLPSHPGCINVCLGDPHALSRIGGFFHRLIEMVNGERDAPRVEQKSRGDISDKVLDSAKLAVDVRLFAFPELSERGIGHYVLPHLRAILGASCFSAPSLLVDSIKAVPQAVEQLASEFRCQVVSLDASRNEQFDVVHLPDLVTLLPGYDSPLRSRPRSEVTSAIFYDLIPLRVPDQHFDRWDPRSRSVYLNRLAQVVAHDCHLFAISECTRRDLIELLAIEPHRVTTILAGQNYTVDCRKSLDGVSAARMKDQHGICKPFFLIVGAIEKHKNFPLALEAFSLVRQSHQCQMVIAGSFSDPFKEAYRELCLKQGITDVIFTGFLKKEELEHLYTAATAVLVPSLYEGFGFPALEAMEHGSPVIASAAASIPEVVGDGGILLPPTDSAAWANAMKRLLDSPEERERYRTRGMARAAEFSWEKNAALVLSVWKEKLNALWGKEDR